MQKFMYINAKDSRGVVETICAYGADEFKNARERRESMMHDVAEYNKSDDSLMYYISSRCTKDFNERQ